MVNIKANKIMSVYRSFIYLKILFLLETKRIVIMGSRNRISAVINFSSINTSKAPTPPPQISEKMILFHT